MSDYIDFYEDTLPQVSIYYSVSHEFWGPANKARMRDYFPGWRNRGWRGSEVRKFYEDVSRILRGEY